MKAVVYFLILSISTIFGIERASSTPYISGDTFRDCADFVFDETSVWPDPSNIKDGSIVFLKTDYIGAFFSQVHPRIPGRYVLITSNSDYYAPCHLGKGCDTSYLDDEKIIGWFAVNIADIKHSKLHPIPLGVANSYWPHGCVEALHEVEALSSNIEKDILLYSNFSEHTYLPERRQLSDLFKDRSYCRVSSPKPFKNYLEDLARSKFVLSPRGNGLDCHRTWEALLMGAIPIVKKSQLDSLYEDLPILIINDWNELSEEFLEQKYQEISQKEYRIEKKYIFYWMDYIRSYMSI